MGVYSFVLRGWGSQSKFGYLGGVRASSQTVSYEIALSIFVFLVFYLFKSFRFFIFNEFLFFINILILVVFILIILSETNRAPFDFREGERELISGFNIEYGSSGFVLFFLSEYSIIIIFSFVGIFFIKRGFILFFVFLYVFIKVRCTFPRFRYDFLIKTLWYYFIPPLCIFVLLIILI